MAQNAVVALTDNAAVAVNFTPVLVSSDQVVFEDLSASTVEQRRRLTTRPGRYTKTRPTNKPFVGIEVPVVRPVGTVNTVVGTIRLNLEAIYPVNATQSEINDAYAFLKSAVSNTLIQGQTRDSNYIT